MPCCPNGTYLPMVQDCGGNVRPLQSNEDLRAYTINGAEPWVQLIEDTTYYVDPGGSDISGDGSASRPWATPFGALDFLARVRPGNYTATVELGYNHYTLDRQILINLPLGGAITFVGERTNTNTLSPTISNIDTSYTDNPNPGPSGTYLSYFDFDVDLTGLTGLSDVKVGDFYSIITISGGTTNTNAIKGLHEIIAYNDSTEVITCRAWHRKGTAALPTGSVQITGGNIQHTTITWETSFDDQAIEVIGSNGGAWNDMVIVGNQNQFDARRGVRVWGGGSFTGNPRLGVHNFDVGIEVYAGGNFEGPVCSMSKIWTLGISAGSHANVRWGFSGATINGCGTAAVQSQQNSTVAMHDCEVIACGNLHAILAWNGGYVDIADGAVRYESSTTSIPIYATTLGAVYYNGASVVGYTTSPTSATQGRIQN